MLASRWRNIETQCLIDECVVIRLGETRVEQPLQGAVVERLEFRACMNWLNVADAVAARCTEIDALVEQGVA